MCARIMRILRNEIKRYPGLRAVLLPLWLRYLDVVYLLRQVLSLPVVYRAGDKVLKLYPSGQIPEALWKHNFEATEREFVASYIKPGMHILNVGANVGIYTILASALVGPAGSVHAFEPSTSTYQRLIRNLQLNNCANVSANHCAVSSTPGQLVLRADPTAPEKDGHRFVEAISTGQHSVATDEVVDAVTLDGYLDRIGPGACSNIDFVVMDIEGAELWALQGAQKLLALSDLTLLLECSQHRAEVEDLLRSAGYRFWRWDSALRAIVPANFKKRSTEGDVIVRRDGWAVSL